MEIPEILNVEWNLTTALNNNDSLVFPTPSARVLRNSKELLICIKAFNRIIGNPSSMECLTNWQYLKRKLKSNFRQYWHYGDHFSGTDVPLRVAYTHICTVTYLYVYHLCVGFHMQIVIYAKIF